MSTTDRSVGRLPSPLARRQAFVSAVSGSPEPLACSLGSPLSTQAGEAVMITCDLSVGTPRSTLARGAVRMRRMTFLFNTKLLIVFVTPRTDNSWSLGGCHGKHNRCFLRLRIAQTLCHVQFNLIIIAIKIIYLSFRSRERGRSRGNDFTPLSQTTPAPEHEPQCCLATDH